MGVFCNTSGCYLLVKDKSNIYHFYICVRIHSLSGICFI
jgi:hypothetical protein